MVQLSQQRKKTRNTYIILGIAILAFVFGCHQMREKQELKKQQTHAIEFLQDSVRYYKNRNNENVATKLALFGEVENLNLLLAKQKDKNQRLQQLVDRYKNVNAAASITQETVIDTFYTTFSEPIQCRFDRRFQKTDPHYYLSGRVNETGIYHDMIRLYDTISLVIGERKNGFLKQRTFSIDAVNSNPNVSITELDAYSFTPKPKRWSLGPYVGYDPFMKRVSAGVSLQYSLIQF